MAEEKEIAFAHWVHIWTKYVVAIAGLGVLLAWGLQGVGILTIAEGWVTMKPITSYAFACFGLGLIFNEKPWFVAMAIGAIVYALLVLLALDGGAVESGNPDYTVAPDLPSWPTVICFVLLAINKKIAAVVSLVIAMVAILGYMLLTAGLHWGEYLFYYVPGISTAMAFHTAGLFLHLSVDQLFTFKEREEFGIFK